MKPTRPFFVALLTLTLLTLFLAGLAWTQSDTPIVISDGSLTIESRGVPWSQFSPGNTRRHPNQGKTLTSVDLLVNGRTQRVTCGAVQCTITAQYDGTSITVSSGANGKGLTVSTDFSAFHGGATPNHLAHNNPNNHIGAISVAGGNPPFNGTGSGHTSITVHYQ